MGQGAHRANWSARVLVEHLGSVSHGAKRPRHSNRMCVCVQGFGRVASWWGWLEGVCSGRVGRRRK
eukprot:1179064-Alexandrium_andersonii.AAC.1